MAQGLTTSQVQERLNVRDPDTVYSLHKAGKIRGNRMGRQWRWDSDSIDEFIRGGPDRGPSIAERGAAARRRASPPPAFFAVLRDPPPRRYRERNAHG